MTTILKQAKLEPLKERRKQNRLILFCNGVHHLVEIPTDNLQRPFLKSTLILIGYDVASGDIITLCVHQGLHTLLGPPYYISE
jgi:hypothetical protein